MNKKILNTIISGTIIFLFSANTFAGGLAEDQPDLARELARTQNELDAQKGKSDDLQNQIDSLNSKLNDLESREPQIIEKTIASSGFDMDEFPITGYASASYADSDLHSEPGTFLQESIDLEISVPLADNFDFYADLAFVNGTDISIDGTEVDGVGDVQAVEVWIDWKANEDKIIFKFGKFCTPFNQWVPCEIPWSSVSIFDPLIVDWGTVPGETTGIQEYGEIPVGDVTLSQAIYIGNGKTSRPHSADGNADKAAGARLGFTIPLEAEESTLTVGISGYIGRDDTDGNNYQEKVWGYDLKLDIGNVTLRGEALKSRINSDALVSNEELHIWKMGWFGQASYRFLEKWETFYRHDFGDEDLRYVDSGDLRIDSIGVTFRPVEKVVFKAGYGWYENDDPELGKYEVVATQVAVIF